MNNTRHQHQVLIVGAGPVGLTAAVLLSQAGMDVAVVEKNSPALDWSEDSKDARVSALNRASYYLLQNIGIWPHLNPKFFSPLSKMHVWDKLGSGTIDFDSQDIGAEQLGFIVENRELVRVLWQYLHTQKNVSFYCPSQPQSIVINSDAVELQLSSATLIGNLLVGADGPNSRVRQHLNIATREKSYRHESLIAVIQAENSHENTAYQNFLPEGPLALLPLADKNQIALVWSLEPGQAQKLMDLSTHDFNRELTNASEFCLGNLKLNSPIKKIPLTERHAKKYVQERIALIGDAAHTIHPLAGQGVNLGLMDAACLAECLIAAKVKDRDLGSLRALRRYERWRKADNLTMLTAMKVFQELFTSQSPWLIQARTIGLNVVDRLSFLKNYFTRYAGGINPDLPEITLYEKTRY